MDNEKIVITINKDKGPSIKLELDVRRTLDGHLLVSDHDHIDIIITADKKLAVYPKNEMNSSVEYAQRSLLKFMMDKGSIERGSVEGNHVYGGLEATIPESEEINSTQAVLMLVGKWILEQKPMLDIEKQDKKKGELRITNPSDEESTELGEVPHAEKKGSLGTGADLIRKYLSGISG